jgi:hypothetical protein
MSGYVETPDDDKTHVYDTVVVALDASRVLNNGEPSGVIAWLDALEIGVARACFTSGAARATASSRHRRLREARSWRSKPSRRSPRSAHQHGDVNAVKSLRRDDHDEHGSSFRLSITAC